MFCAWLRPINKTKTYNKELCRVDSNYDLSVHNNEFPTRPSSIRTKVIFIYHILSYFNVGHTAKRHFKLYGDSISLLPLKLSYSRRASHQISTHVLQILLEEVLGYEDVMLVPDNSGFSVTDALLKLAGCVNHRYMQPCIYIYSMH